MANMDTTSIDFILKKDEAGHEIMECEIDGSSYQLDFTSENQDYLRGFFMAAIRHLQKEKFHFRYTKEEDFANTILEEVARDYISRLNMELDSVFGGLEELNSLGVTAKSKCPESDLIICPET